jgi:hypothetical protein
MIQAVKDDRPLYEVERRAEHAARPGFRITELPKEEVRLKPGQTYTARARRAHLVTNGGEKSATFLVLQGIGEYDFVPLVEPRK